MEQYLTDFDWSVLRMLGLEGLPDDHNPITRALSDDPDFASKVKSVKSRCLSALSRLGVICQVNYFNGVGGPEGDGKPKALRRHWYSYFKSELAQPFSTQVGKDLQAKNWTNNWTQRMSDVYGELVQETALTYRDLWVSDGSRMMDLTNEPLFSNCNIIVAIEKDSLFEDFSDAAQRLGAPVLYSAKGKSSAAAIEKVLRESFEWTSRNDPFSDDHPLYVLHVSDWDYDGEGVIGPCVGTQCRLFTPHVREARVGINPHQVLDAGFDYVDKWYEVKTAHNGYKEWLDTKGIEGRYGFEVEALRVSHYYTLLVDALLSVMDFDYIVSALRDECKPGISEAVRKAQSEIESEYKELQRIKKGIDDYERKLWSRLYRLADKHKDDIQPPDGDPTPDDYREHVAGDGVTPWRPFSDYEQTQRLRDFLLDKYRDELAEIKLEW